MEFQSNNAYIDFVSKKTKELQDSAEEIFEIDVVKALNVLNFIQYRCDADVFLGCSAMNLLNAYVKQDNSKLSYTFRKHLPAIFLGIKSINSPNIETIYDNSDNRKIVMICINGFQFSFKSEKLTLLLSEIISQRDIPWDGIRKQKCAQTIFYYALENDFLTNRTIGGQTLTDYVAIESDNYEEGLYSFVNGELIRKKKIEHLSDGFTSAEDIHYFRKRMYDHQDMPVILQAKFAKVWPKHVTFLNVKPYIRGINSRTVCNHINLYRKELEKQISLEELQQGHSYIIIGVCKFYGKENNRIGVNVVQDFGIPAVMPFSDFYKIPNDVFDKCLKFSIEKYASGRQTHIKL